MKRLPLIPTIVVALAAAGMIWLGLWQLHRARWKEGLLATYAANTNLPAIALPNVPDAKNPPLFRRASGYCLRVTGWEAKAGRNTADQAGWSHIARCATGAEGPGLSVDAGWSRDAKNPVWSGGPVEGRLAPDTKHVYRLVATTPAPGLKPSAPPSLDEIPNNHRAYAVQWFIFAALAVGTYLLALRRRKAA
ncbi:SURF1-like protein [Sphingomonas antarctica]|uniref:SURF1 family protein n=1 Tax=Sphingomonas antarctica TaxID=2040274 RepID=UPI0039E93116